MRRVAALVVVAGVLARSAGAAPAPYLVKDLNTVGRGIGASWTAVAGGTVFFVGDDGHSGRELWKSDGSAAGTIQVADLVPGPEGSDPEQLVGGGNLLFFTAEVTKDSHAVWRTDGTAAGTWPVSEDFAQSEVFETNPRELVPVGGGLYFTAFDTSGWRLWKSDGARLGAVRVTDVPADGTIGSLTEANGALYFTAGGGLWTTAPGVDGARPLFAPAGGSVSGPIRHVGDGLYFGADEGAGVGLYHLPLAGGAPVRVSDVPSAVYSEWAALHGELYFVVDSALWRSDGTRAGTSLAVALSLSLYGAIFDLTAIGDTLYFTADEGVAGREVWKSDGVTAARLVDVYPGSSGSNPYLLTDVNGTLFFSVGYGTTGSELWRSDGTGPGTGRVASVAAGYMTALGSRLFFAGADGAGQELWVSDGTPAGTHQVIDLLRQTEDADPVAMVDGAGTLYLVARDGEGLGLWKSDGTAAGTVPVAEASTFADWSEYAPLAAVGGTVFFAGPGRYQTALWRTDGTPGGTRPLLDLGPNVFSYGLLEFTPFADALYFTADDGMTGQELWRSDGTVRQTVELLDLTPGPTSSVGELAVVKGTLYFTGSDGVTGRELWKSDGTGPGTVQVADLNPGRGGSYPSRLTAVGDTLFFLASRTDDPYDVSLWKSDGTAAGTVPLMGFGGIGSPTVVGDLLFFRVDGENSSRLWRTDGTEAGTIPIAEFEPGSRGPLDLTALNGRLVFTADDGTTGREPWTSDGTAAGTVPFIDIAPGRRGSFPASLAPIGDQLYFSAEDGVSGSEPWVSDGTAAGTRQLADLQPGRGSSAPGRFTRSGDFLFFVAADPMLGRELWALAIGCGDGAPDAGEECDDGNRLDGDDCSARCRRQCVGDDECADGDPCTTDRCGGGACAHEALVGYEAALCRVDEMISRSPCPDGPVSPRLHFADRLERVKDMLAAAAAARPRRTCILLRRTDKILRKVERKSARLRDAGRMSEACAAAVTAAVGARRAEVAALRPPSKRDRTPSSPKYP